VLQPSERITVRTNEALNIFYVEITCATVAVAPANRAVYALEACVPGGEQCYRSSITVYAIERPPLLGKTNYFYHDTSCYVAMKVNDVIWSERRVHLEKY
jgi:hypothetical protein